MATNPNVVRRETSGKTEHVLYIYQTDVDIFRAGKKDDTRMTRLRYEEDDRPPPKANDIATYYDPDGKLHVRAGTGGISLFSGMNRNRRMGRADRWWCIPQGTACPDKIRIAKDAEPGSDGLTHYSIEPKTDMLLEDFIEELKKFSEFMYKVDASTGSRLEE
jgi:hypothetical protein